MTAYLYDAAYKPDLARVKANGGIGMTVYLTGMYALTCAQPSELHAAGLGALGNYEEGPSELETCGFSGGFSIGQRAASAAVAKGFPAKAGKGIAFSLDVNTPASAFPAVGQAFLGIAHGLAGQFVPLAYGEGAAIDYLWVNHEVQGIEWLAAPSSWPGFNPSDPRVGLVQLVGSPVGGTDQDKITNLDALAPLIWWPTGSPYDTSGGLTVSQIDDILTAISQLKSELESKTQYDYGPDPKTHQDVVVSGTVEGIVQNVVGKAIAPLAGQLSALTQAVATLQKGNALTAADIEQAAAKGAQDTLDQYQLALEQKA